MKKKNILITGGCGYIGSQVAHLFSTKKNFEITIVDNLSTGNIKLAPKNAKFYNIDITNIQKLEKIFKLKKFDADM